MKNKRIAVLIGASLALGAIVAVLFRRPKEALHEMSRTVRVGGEDFASSTTSSRQNARTPPPVFNVLPGANLDAVERMKKGVRLASSYNEEGRDPVWAPKMESALTKRFQGDHSNIGLPGLRNTEIECRTTTCRFVLEYPESLSKAIKSRAIADGLSPHQTPTDYLGYEMGPIAQAGDFVSSEQTTDASGLKMERWTYVYGFGPKIRDPQDYETWFRSANEKTTAADRKAFWANNWKKIQAERAADQEIMERRAR